MNAQRRWKHYYRQIIDGLIVPEYISDQRNDMSSIRREAALERKLEAAQRRIAQLESDINALFEPDDPPSEPYSEMDLLQREAAGLP